MAYYIRNADILNIMFDTFCLKNKKTKQQQHLENIIYYLMAYLLVDFGNVNGKSDHCY